MIACHTKLSLTLAQFENMIPATDHSTKNCVSCNNNHCTNMISLYWLHPLMLTKKSNQHQKYRCFMLYDYCGLSLWPSCYIAHLPCCAHAPSSDQDWANWCVVFAQNHPQKFKSSPVKKMLGYVVNYLLFEIDTGIMSFVCACIILVRL